MDTKLSTWVKVPGFDRGEDHLFDLKSHNQKNAPVKHLTEKHNGEHWDMFNMKILRVHKTSLVRQIEEGHMIANFTGGEVLNQKGEWG